MKKIITYSTSNGKTISVCKSCEKKLARNWPTNERGEEYATVIHGLHKGKCDICNK